MAAPTNLYRLQWGGPLFNNERWSCSVHIEAAVALGVTSAAFVPALSAWMSTAAIHSAAARLSEVKFNQLNPLTGRYLSLGATDVVEVNPAVAGGGTAVPGQITLAVSLLTAQQRGRGHQGRIYPPSSDRVTQVDANGAVSDLAAIAARDATRVLLDAVNAIIVPVGRVVIWSKVGNVVVPVTGVRVGHITDTQRRRRRSLDESPTLVAGLA